MGQCLTMWDGMETEIELELFSEKHKSSENTHSRRVMYYLYILEYNACFIYTLFSIFDDK